MEMAPAGDRGLLVTLRDATAAGLRAAADRTRAIAGVEACVIGHESLLVIGRVDGEELRAAIVERRPLGRRRRAEARRSTPAEARRSTRAAIICIDVSFRDEYALDLGDLPIPRDELLRRIGDVPLTVRYLGFRAGWAYCDGWPEAWRLPRRATSRNVVPRGSFAVAGAMAGFYPDDCPGGWNVLGRTGTPLWDPRRERPNLLAPGDEVRIVPNEERIVVEVPPAPSPSGEVIAEIVAPGQLTTIVGARDWRLAERGETPGGPFDAAAAALANRAAGNPDDAPLLECVLVGPRITTPRRAAWCGGDLRVRVLTGGIDVGRVEGFRGYLAIEGGVAGEGLVKKGELRQVERQVERRASARREKTDPGGLKPAAPPAAPRTDRLTLRVLRGPHDAPDLSPRWQVSSQLNRVGIRLRPLEAATVEVPADLPSIGVQFGTLQWHPDGSIVAMGPEHPVTGGYLQPATVISDDLWKLGQLAPGEMVTLVAE